MLLREDARLFPDARGQHRGRFSHVPPTGAALPRKSFADANMADAIDDFVPGELWKCTGYDCDVVVSRNEFLRESEPAFFNRAAHDRWNRQKRAEHDGDFHRACKIASSEAAARLISNRRRKQFRALTRSRFCSSGEVCNQRSINRVVPARSSGST